MRNEMDDIASKGKRRRRQNSPEFWRQFNLRSYWELVGSTSGRWSQGRPKSLRPPQPLRDTRPVGHPGAILARAIERQRRRPRYVGPAVGLVGSLSYADKRKRSE